MVSALGKSAANCLCTEIAHWVYKHLFVKWLIWHYFFIKKSCFFCYDLGFWSADCISLLDFQNETCRLMCISIHTSVNGDWADKIPLSACCIPLIKRVIQFLYKATQIIVLSILSNPWILIGIYPWDIGKEKISSFPFLPLVSQKPKRYVWEEIWLFDQNTAFLWLQNQIHICFEILWQFGLTVCLILGQFGLAKAINDFKLRSQFWWHLESWLEIIITLKPLVREI